MENWEPKLCILFFFPRENFSKCAWAAYAKKNFSLATHPNTFARFFEGIQYR